MALSEKAEVGAIQSSTVVLRETDPIATVIDGEVVMLSPQAQAYFGLGDVGSEIWNMIERPKRVDELCVALQEEFNVDPDTCAREVLSFLNDLLARGLVRIVLAEEQT
jgi:hypothetical protein